MKGSARRVLWEGPEPGKAPFRFFGGSLLVLLAVVLEVLWEAVLKPRTELLLLLMLLLLGLLTPQIPADDCTT